MSAQQMLATISERLQTAATVRSVYGDAISVDGRTVIPVATVAYGFGAGGGVQNGGQEPAKEGGGGGGGVAVRPTGVLEITAEGTRFIPFVDKKRLALAGLAGVLLGWWAARCR